jgi:predicted nucleotide-binding protein (sugar kinase/HSP70/actin superfamily)
MVEKMSPLAGRTLYIPQMCSGSSTLFSAAFRALGIDARPCPDSDAKTRELAAKHCTGDECYPQLVTMGDFLKVIHAEGFVAEKTAFFMPSAAGPCRFGQYCHLVRRMLDKLGLQEVLVVSPTFDNNYNELGDNGPEAMHYLWWGVVAADLLRKMLHRTRPYELTPGTTDKVYRQSIEAVEKTLEQPQRRKREKFSDLLKTLGECRGHFDAIAANYQKDRLLIGVIGEIFCRLNTFSNDDLIRSIEAAGGEVWLADISEWVFYVNYWGQEELRTFGGRWSGAYFKGWLSDLVQHREEQRLHEIFADALIGWDEPEQIGELLKLGQPYIEPHAALGEMILNLSKSVWLHRHGADGILDLSPFSCMNGVACEAIYPKLSRDLEGLPIRILYFDGTQGNLEDDVAIFMEMAAHYAGRKTQLRRWPERFREEAPLQALPG